MKKIFFPIISVILAFLWMITSAFTTVSAAAGAPMASPAVAMDTTFTVNSTLDQPDDLTIPGTCHTAAGTCTLRAAVMQGGASGAGATILLPSGTYALTVPAAVADGEENGDLNLTTPSSGGPVITITGAGAGTTSIDANKLDRVFTVGYSRTAVISGVTISNGYISGANAFGGGILNQGFLTVSSATITANHAISLGGGIDNIGILTVANSILSKNVSDFSGGAIQNSGSVNVINSTLSQNTAGSGGGAITNTTNLKVNNSTIFGNTSYDGGGIYTESLNLYVINSTISQNIANHNGGGIYKHGTDGLAALYNTSVIGNDADHDRDQTGGIGGGIYVDAGARFIVVNSLLAGNTMLNTPIYDDCDGTLEAYGQNLFGDMSGCTVPNVLNAGLIILNTIGPLQNNGGPTWTHALLPGSEAINSTIDALGCVDETGALLKTDQRGFARVVGVRCDVGAFEYSPPLLLYLPLIHK